MIIAFVFGSVQFQELGSVTEKDASHAAHVKPPLYVPELPHAYFLHRYMPLPNWSKITEAKREAHVACAFDTLAGQIVHIFPAFLTGFMLSTTGAKSSKLDNYI